VQAWGQFWAVLYQGKLKSLVEIETDCWPDQRRFVCGNASPHGAIVRNSEIHAFAAYNGDYQGWYGLAYPGGWFIVAIGADGILRELQPKVIGQPETPGIWSERGWYDFGVTFADATLQRFGWRGKLNGSEIVGTYEWNATEKLYTLTWWRATSPWPPPRR